MEGIKTIQGRMEAKGLKIAIVATRFNDFMVDHLIGGAVDYLTRHGAVKDDLTLIRIPGPSNCRSCANVWPPRGLTTALWPWARLSGGHAAF